MEPFLKSYYEHFKFKSIDSFQFKEFFLNAFKVTCDSMSAINSPDCMVFLYSKSRIIGAPVDMDKVGYYWLYSYALCLDYFHNGRLLGCANYPAFTVSGMVMHIIFMSGQILKM